MNITKAQRRRLLDNSKEIALQNDKIPTTMRHGKATVEEGFSHPLPGILAYSFELVKKVDDKRREARCVIIATTLPAWLLAKKEKGIEGIELVK